jgi:tetratricopeptide (TPR) repeat protein
MKKIIVSYGCLIVASGIFGIFFDLLPEAYSNAFQPAEHWITKFAVWTCIIFYLFPINFIIGYGLIRLRPWARYGVIAVMLTFPIHVLTQSMWWGIRSIQTGQSALQLLVIVLTLAYFSRQQVRLLFGEEYKFKVKSWAGLLVGCIFLFASTTLLTALYFKVYQSWKYDEPFIVPTPQVISLTRPPESKVSQTYRKVELFDMKFLIPKGFAIYYVRQPDESSDSWRVTLFSPEKKRGLIMLGNSYPFADAIFKDFNEATRITSKFELEKFFLTNNWNPAASTLRLIAQPIGQNIFIKEFHFNGKRGFLKIWRRDKSFMSDFSLYNNDETRYTSGTISLDKGVFSEDDILNIISSIEFLDTKEPRNAEDYFERGMQYYSNEQFIDAQFEFANAYYKSPENPDYIYMLAKSLTRDGVKKYKKIKEILDIALSIDPKHEGAKELLKEIESELSKDKS